MRGGELDLIQMSCRNKTIQTPQIVNTEPCSYCFHVHLEQDSMKKVTEISYL